MRRRAPRPNTDPLPYNARVMTVHSPDGTWAIYVWLNGERHRFDSVEAYDLWLRTIT